MKRFASLALCLALVACQGDMGPTGPAGPAGATGPMGPAGPQGPAGPGVAYLTSTGPITAQVMYTTPFVNTGGHIPTGLCYITDDFELWITYETNDIAQTGCLLVQEGDTWGVSGVFPNELVNSGWTVRFILFWSTG